MKRYLALALTFASIGAWALTHAHEVRAQTRGNQSFNQSGVYKNPSPEEYFIRGSQAGVEWQLGRGGNAGTLGGTTHIYNGTVNNDCIGCVSSGSNQTNIHNQNVVDNDVSASGGSSVIIGTNTSQNATGSQAGAANAGAMNGSSGSQSSAQSPSN